MSEWIEAELAELIYINPRVSLAKNTIAKKVPMEFIMPYTKKISQYVNESYKGGVKFINGDTLMARITPSLENGKTSFVDFLKDNEIGFGSTEFIVLRAKENISDPNFVYYLAISPEIREVAIQSMTGSSGRQRVQDSVVKNFLVSFPTLQEQQAIAQVLSSLDDKINLLHRQNQTLEQMAETLFRKWFIEEAKEEWKIGFLPEEFDFTMGQSPPGETYNEDAEGIPMYQGNADFGFRFPSLRVFTTDPKRLAQKYDTLISVRAPVGAQNMAFENCCIGRGVAAFRYNKAFCKAYTYYKLMSLMSDIKQFNDTGTVFGSISKSDFERIEILVPPYELVMQFEREAGALDDKIINNVLQIKTLEQQRDTLLPKLMSGEVRVKIN